VPAEPRDHRVGRVLERITVPGCISVRGGIAVLACAAACSAATPAPATSDSNAQGAVIAAVRTPSADSAAMLDSLTGMAHRIDRDTLRLERKQTAIALGAGTSGTLTAWRVGRIWRRLHLDSDASAFRTSDTYWFDNGVLFGAQLELTRSRRKAAVDSVWFRNRELYRWTDAEGRHLEGAARSTQYEVQMLRARLDSLLRTLDRDDIVRRPHN
jgi:hypothetical protein